VGGAYVIIIDDFLGSYDDLKAHALAADFGGAVNPVDGVEYPHICADVPDAVRSEIIERLTSSLGREPESVTLFMRRSPEGCHVPHIAHTDNSMGLYSLMLYMNDAEGGTAFIRHRETGVMYAPESQDMVDFISRDQNSPEKWALVDMAHMKENRAVIFDAGKFHCAMPIGGFGEGSEARAVLTVFFS
jgi:hypothetical protein